MPTYIHVDVETTSTNTANALVLSIGAIEEESQETFHRVFHHVDNEQLSWDKGTWDWWHHPDQEQARLRMIEKYEKHQTSPHNAAHDFHNWVQKFNNGQPPTFCAWPASFDYPLVVEFLWAYELPSPFHYRTLDVKSYLCGKLGIDIDAPRTAFPQWAEENPQFPHDALSDAIAQMEVFRKVRAI